MAMINRSDDNDSTDEDDFALMALGTAAMIRHRSAQRRGQRYFSKVQCGMETARFALLIAILSVQIALIVYLHRLWQSSEVQRVVTGVHAFLDFYNSPSFQQNMTRLFSIADDLSPLI